MLEGEERTRLKKSSTLYYDTKKKHLKKHNKKKQLAPGQLGARAQRRK